MVLGLSLSLLIVGAAASRFGSVDPQKLAKGAAEQPRGKTRIQHYKSVINTDFETLPYEEGEVFTSAFWADTPYQGLGFPWCYSWRKYMRPETIKDWDLEIVVMSSVTIDPGASKSLSVATAHIQVDRVGWSEEKSHEVSVSAHAGLVIGVPGPEIGLSSSWSGRWVNGNNGDTSIQEESRKEDTDRHDCPPKANLCTLQRWRYRTAVTGTWVRVPYANMTCLSPSYTGRDKKVSLAAFPMQPCWKMRPIAETFFEINEARKGGDATFSTGAEIEGLRLHTTDSVATNKQEGQAKYTEWLRGPDGREIIEDIVLLPDWPKLSAAARWDDKFKTCYLASGDYINRKGPTGGLQMWSDKVGAYQLYDDDSRDWNLPDNLNKVCPLLKAPVRVTRSAPTSDDEGLDYITLVDGLAKIVSRLPET